MPLTLPPRRTPLRDPSRRVAIYAVDDEERTRLREYVRQRGWDCFGNEYAGSEWAELIANARLQRFHAICACLDGVCFFAPVGQKIRFESLLPKRATPPGPPKGEVVGGRGAVVDLAVRLIGERGPQSLNEITQAVIANGIGKGTLPAIRGIVLGALRGSGRLCQRDGRWRLWVPKPPRGIPKRPPSEEQRTLTIVNALAGALADAFVRSLLNSPEVVQALIARVASRTGFGCDPFTCDLSRSTDDETLR